MLDTFGWIGSIMFAVCAFPQAFQSYKEGHSNGLNWGLLNMWLVGEICMLIYVFPMRDMPLIFNYVANLLSLLLIIRYKVSPR